MSQRLQFVFLSTQLPFPPKSGGLIKSWRLLKHLSFYHDIHVVCCLKGDDNKHLESFKSSMKLASCTAVEIQMERTPLNLVRSYLLADSLNVFRSKSTIVKNAVLKLVEHADLLIVDHYEMGQYIPLQMKAKCILHQHNAEYVMWKRFSELETNLLKKSILKIESRRIALAERKYAELADLIWAAPNDIIELEKIGIPRDKMKVTYHLGEDEMLQWPEMQFDQTECTVLFVGTLTWEANIDGLLWFINNCWVKITNEVPQVKFKIVGRNPDERLVKLASSFENIFLLGFVDSLELVYSSSRVFITPLRFGSGIKVKVLNALYRGIPLVTTEIGVEGIDAENGIHLYFTDQDPIEFGNCVIALLENKYIWKQMSEKARILGTKYTWQKLIGEHQKEIDDLLQSESIN